MYASDLKDWETDLEVLLLGRYGGFKLCTQDEVKTLDRLRARGESRPENVSYGDWYGPRRFTIKMKAMCEFLVAGSSLTAISSEFKVSVDRLATYIFSSSMARREVMSLIRDREQNRTDDRTT